MRSHHLSTLFSTLVSRYVPLFLLLMLCVFGALAAPESALNRQQALALLEDAGKGEFAALEVALPNIDDPALNALARAHVAASRLDEASARQALEEYFASGDNDAETRSRAWSIAAGAAFSHGDYARAAEAIQRQMEVSGDDEGDRERAQAIQFYGIASRLADVPAQKVVARAAGAVPTARDAAGLLRATVSVNGHAQEAVIDTGANLSVLSATAAKDLGVRLLDGEGSVGSGTQHEVAVRLGMAERLEFAGVTLANVAFLVLDDAQLEMPLPGGYKIDAIVGFPVLRALDRITFEAGGRLSAEPVPAGRRETAGNLRVIGNSMYVGITVNGIPVTLQLDTGASESLLSSRFAQRHPGILEGLERRQQNYAGAGGAVTRQVAVWEDVEVAIGDRTTVLPALSIATTGATDEDGPDAALLGTDVLGAFDAYIIDFVNMRLELGAPEE